MVLNSYHGPEGEAPPYKVQSTGSRLGWSPAVKNSYPRTICGPPVILKIIVEPPLAMKFPSRMTQILNQMNNKKMKTPKKSLL